MLNAFDAYEVRSLVRAMNRIGKPMSYGRSAALSIADYKRAVIEFCDGLIEADVDHKVVQVMYSQAMDSVTNFAPVAK